MRQRAFDIASFIFSIFIYVVLVALVAFGSKVALNKDKSVSEFEIILVDREPDLKQELPKVQDLPSKKTPKNESIKNKLVENRPKKAVQKSQTNSKNSQTAQNSPKTNIAHKDIQISQNTKPATNSQNLATANQIAYLGEDNQIFKLLKDEIAKNTIYPRAAKRANLTGVVGVEFEISTSGISNEKISRPSRHQILNDAALKALKTAKPNLEKIDKKYSVFMEIVFELR